MNKTAQKYARIAFYFSYICIQHDITIWHGLTKCFAHFILVGKFKFRPDGHKVRFLKLSKLSSHQSAFISGFRLKRCLRTHICSHERIHLMWYETHEWRSGKAKSTHITQKEREHKSGTLEELSWSYQAEKQTSLQRTLQRVNQILQQQPLTHAHLSKPESNSHRGEPECTWVEWTSNVMYWTSSAYLTVLSIFDISINQGFKAIN